MVGVTVNRVNVLGAIHALLKCYTVYISEVIYEMFHILNCGFEIKCAMIIAVVNAI